MSLDQWPCLPPIQYQLEGIDNALKMLFGSLIAFDLDINQPEIE
jgi:hypothetical protein